MTVAKVIQHRTRPECADENERLIRAVFAELAESKPEGLRYLTTDASLVGSYRLVSPE